MSFLARIGRPDILWSVHKRARAVTKWTKPCDKRLARLISYMHDTSDIKQYCYVGTRHINVNWNYFKTQILPVTEKTQNQHRVESHAFSEVTRSCQ